MAHLHMDRWQHYRAAEVALESGDAEAAIAHATLAGVDPMVEAQARNAAKQERKTEEEGRQAAAEEAAEAVAS